MSGIKTRPGRPSLIHATTAALDAAIELVAERGLDGFSMADVADRAGIGRTTLYRRWKSREALVIEAVSRPIAAEHTADLPDSGDLRTDLQLLGHQFQQFMERETVGRIVLQLVAAAVNDPRWAEVFHDHIANQRKKLRQLVRRAIERQELPPETDVDLALDLVAAPAWFWLLVRRSPLTETAIADAREVVLRGLQYRAPSGRRK